LLLVGAIVLIFWNESRAVDAIRGLKQGTAALVEASADHVDPAMDGRLVHITGLLAVGVPAEDPVLGLRHQGVARLKREVEMLQWVEHSESVSHTDVGGRKTTETTYSYSTDWQERPVDSTRFHVRDGHQNPQMSLQTAVFDSPSPSIGGRTVSPEVMPVLPEFFDPLPVVHAADRHWRLCPRRRPIVSRRQSEPAGGGRSARSLQCRLGRADQRARRAAWCCLGGLSQPRWLSDRARGPW